MKTACEYVKFGGCLGFTTVFLWVLLRDRDVVSAVFDASIACVVMAFAFKLLHRYTRMLHMEVVRSRQDALAEQDEEESGHGSNLKAISDRSITT